jgi:hypothetical protein
LITILASLLGVVITHLGHFVSVAHKVSYVFRFASSALTARSTAPWTPRYRQ